MLSMQSEHCALIAAATLEQFLVSRWAASARVAVSIECSYSLDYRVAS